MSKRLQVVVSEAELRGFRRAAGGAGLTISEWVRQVLRSAERATAMADPSKKLDSVRTAAGYAFPTADIDRMLEEIERGYEADPSR